MIRSLRSFLRGVRGDREDDGLCWPEDVPSNGRTCIARRQDKRLLLASDIPAVWTVEGLRGGDGGVAWSPAGDTGDGGVAWSPSGDAGDGTCDPNEVRDRRAMASARFDGGRGQGRHEGWRKVEGIVYEGGVSQK